MPNRRGRRNRRTLPSSPSRESFRRPPTIPSPDTSSLVPVAIPRSVCRAFAVRALAGVGLLVLVGARADAQSLQTYTDSQAVRGQRWFEYSCVSCHPTQDMSSADFKVRWGGLTAQDLYRIISTTMPQNEPGTLSARAYADVVSYLMKINGIPAGPLALTTDSSSLTAARLHFGAPSSPRN